MMLLGAILSWLGHVSVVNLSVISRRICFHNVVLCGNGLLLILSSWSEGVKRVDYKRKGPDRLLELRRITQHAKHSALPGMVFVYTGGHQHDTYQL